MSQGSPAPALPRPPAGLPEVAPKIVTVVVTRDRQALLRRCLGAVAAQSRPADGLLVVDNASADDTPAIIRQHAGATHLRLETNSGGAGGFRAGIAAALDDGAEFLWLMDDDGMPSDNDCLERLLATAVRTGADIVGPLSIDPEEPERLSFPVRLEGRTRFLVREVEDRPVINGFAHLFNGVLVRASLFHLVGLPDERLFIRGDEVEFLYRARRHGVSVMIDTAARFLHPSTKSEIHPILGGAFYAVVPGSEMKRYYQFRNRGHIFRSYGMWSWLAADVVRYGTYYLINRRLDIGGFTRWATTTWKGVRGDFSPWRP
ncbi:MAG TPA: glycosyltransferase [Azospirillaceae bacterium]|nr:glycosyltransferase [Azospirillaceae bacterium]